MGWDLKMDSSTAPASILDELGQFGSDSAALQVIAGPAALQEGEISDFETNDNEMLSNNGLLNTRIVIGLETT